MTTRHDNPWQILWSTRAATSVLRILALALLATLLIGPASAVEEGSEFVEAWKRALPGEPAATEANQQQRFRDLAEIVLKGLDDYREQLSMLPLEGLATASEALLDLRDAAAAGGGYANLLVADALNRVLFVELTTRLVRLGSAPPELEAAVDRLAGYEIAPRKLVAMAEEELGRSVPGVEEARADSGARGVFYHLFQDVGGDLAHLAGLRSSEELAASTVYQLLESPNLARLLTRYWQTDYGIHIRLPLLARYLRETGGGVERYDYEHLRATLDLSSEQFRQSYGSIINRTRRTAVSGVLALVEEVRSGGIDAFVAFGEAGSDAESQKLAITSFQDGEEVILAMEQDTTSGADVPQQREVTFRLTASPYRSADGPRQLWHATTTVSGAIQPWPYWEASLLSDEARSRLLLTLVFNRGVTAMTLDVFPIPLAADAEPQPPTREQPIPVAPDLTQRSLVHYEGALPVDSGGVESVDSELRDDILAVTIHVQSEYVAPLDLEIDLVTGEVRESDRAGVNEATERGPNAIRRIAR